VVDAIAQGGIITFDCGPDPITIVLEETAKIFNNTGPKIVIDGEDKVTLSGDNQRRILQDNGLPVYVVNSTFGGRDDLCNTCSNGGGICSIGVSRTIINSLFPHNKAIGYGDNPPAYGSPGGGSDGAIYNDGLTMTLTLCGRDVKNYLTKISGSDIFS